jgi:hypothetical protein
VLGDEAAHLHLQLRAEDTAPRTVKAALPLIDALDLRIDDLCGWSLDPLQDLHRIRVEAFGMEGASIGCNNSHFNNLLSEMGDVY